MRQAVITLDTVDLFATGGDLEILAHAAVKVATGEFYWVKAIAGGAPRPVALRPVPTLDALVRDLTLVDGLAVATLIDLEAQAAHLGIALRAALTKHLVAHLATPTPSPPDRLVRLQEAAGLLGMSADFLYRHWQQLDGRKDEDGRIRFPLSAIQHHVRGR